MKKVIAVLAASAVAVSMFAFAGCKDNDDKKTDSGAIPGDYVEKTPDEMGGILDDFFGNQGGDETPVIPATSSGMGIKVKLNESLYCEGLMDITSSVSAEFKEKITETGFVGAGSATVKAHVKSMDFNTDGSVVSTAMTDKYAIDVTATAYNDSSFIYGGATGSVGTVNDSGKFETMTLPEGMKAKLNHVKLMEALGGGSTGPEISTPASAIFETNDAFDMAALLAMADQFSVKISADLSDGMKIKISATEETIWKIATVAFIEQGATEAEASAKVAKIKGYVSVNKFTLDVYAAFDSSKTLTAASVVIDCDVKADMKIMNEFMPNGTAAVADQKLPDISMKVAGSVEIYSHNDNVELPANIATDASYADKTDDLIELISQMI